MATDDEFGLIGTGDDHIIIDGQEEQVRRRGGVGTIEMYYCISWKELYTSRHVFRHLAAQYSFFKDKQLQ